LVLRLYQLLLLFSFTDPAPTLIHTLSLHDALPIYLMNDYYAFLKEKTLVTASNSSDWVEISTPFVGLFNDTVDIYAKKEGNKIIDRKSTRLNSSHVKISYAVFCLKKKKKKTPHNET